MFPGPDMAACVNSCIPTECTDLSNHGSKKKYIPSVTSALIVGSILGLLQAIFLVFSAKFVLSIMGVKSVSAIMLPFSAQPQFGSVVSCIIIRFVLFLVCYSGFANARACSSLPNNKITWCTCCATVPGHARGFPGFQGHKDTVICYW
jgi:hypothetical protein